MPGEVNPVRPGIHQHLVEVKEPRSFGAKVAMVAAGALVVAGITFGIMYAVDSNWTMGAVKAFAEYAATDKGMISLGGVGVGLVLTVGMLYGLERMRTSNERWLLTRMTREQLETRISNALRHDKDHYDGTMTRVAAINQIYALEKDNARFEN